MKLVALGGVPCSGKTTLALRFIQRNMPGATSFKFRKVSGSFKNSLVVIGIYDDERVFSGTDRLSMAVQPDFLAWIQVMEKTNPGARIFLEGDRLFNASVLRSLALLKVDVLALVLDIPEDVRTARRASRGDTQSEKFVSGRRTKYENVLSANLAEKVPHSNPQDSDRVLERIETFLGIPTLAS